MFFKLQLLSLNIPKISSPMADLISNSNTSASHEAMVVFSQNAHFTQPTVMTPQWCYSITFQAIFANTFHGCQNCNTLKPALWIIMPKKLHL